MRKYDILILTVFALQLTLLTVLTVTSPYPNGTDVWFHVLVARAYYRGENGMFSSVVMDINNIPYPPIFHLFLMPFTYSVDAALFASKVLQLIFYPVGVLAWALLIRKYTNAETAFIFTLAIAGTYFSFSQMQAKPESMALMILPLAIYTFMEKKTVWFILVSASLFYIYSPYSLALLLGLLAYALKRSWKSLQVWGTGVLSAPMLLIQASFINEQFFHRWVTQGDLGLIQETREFYASPFWFIINGFGLNIAAFFLVPYAFYRWKEQTTFTKMMLLTFLGMLIVFPVWVQRTFGLIIIPSCFIMALYVQRLQNKKLKLILLTALIAQAIVFSLLPAWWMSPVPYLDKYWNS